MNVETLKQIQNALTLFNVRTKEIMLERLYKGRPIDTVPEAEAQAFLKSMQGLAGHINGLAREATVESFRRNKPDFIDKPAATEAPPMGATDELILEIQRIRRTSSNDAQTRSLAQALQRPASELAAAVQCLMAITAGNDEKAGYDAVASLTAIMPHMPTEVFTDTQEAVLAALHAIRHDAFRAQALAALAPRLPPACLVEACRQVVRESLRLKYGEESGWEIIRVAGHMGKIEGLPHDVWETLLGQAGKIAFYSDDDHFAPAYGEDAEVLSARVIVTLVLSPQWPEALSGLALRACEVVNTDRERAWAASLVAERLPVALIVDGLGAAHTDAALFPLTATVILERLAPKLTGEQLTEALELAETIRRADFRERALAALNKQSGGSRADSTSASSEKLI